MKELNKRSRGQGKVYFTGGATSLLFGFREQTIDIDLKMDPEPPGAFEAIAILKNELDVNIEMASPDNFVAPLPDWKARSKEIEAYSNITYYHFDLVSQALSKLERGFSQDLDDVRAYIDAGMISTEDILEGFKATQEQLLRYPNIDVEEFEEKVSSFVTKYSKKS